MDFDVRPLTSDNLVALERLFEEGGDPSWCFCMSFRIPQTGTRQERAEENRAMLGEFVDTSPTALGLVAISDERAIGWVSLAPRADYPRLGRSAVYAPVDEMPVWSIVCFVVSRESRGRGMMSGLLDAAIDFARSQGAVMLEAYPSDTGDRRVGSGYGYAGFRSLYERAGFEVVAARCHTPGATPRLTMRLDLSGSPHEATNSPKKR